ncbi:MAG: hypothetical protein KBT04_06860, partial [Bacteroidales bacterium]|nr:hypothetical protein [Candidatus Colimorpha onthohippi]
MKRLFCVLILFFWAGWVSHLCAQAPQAVTYQSVVRDMQGNLLPNTSVLVRLNILQNSVAGAVVYSEEHYASTNSNSLITLLIGKGRNLLGSFADIKWNQYAYYLRSEIYLHGITTPLTTTVQFVSVPYALSSIMADTAMALKIGNVIFTGSYTQLSNRPTIPTVPTRISSFINDAGYLTRDSLPPVTVVPTHVSAFVNDMGYITRDSLPSSIAVPTALSAFTNDVGFISSESQNLSAVTLLGNDAGNKQLKGLQDPTDSQDAVTYHLLEEVRTLALLSQTRIDSLGRVMGAQDVRRLIRTLQYRIDSLSTAMEAQEACSSWARTLQYRIDSLSSVMVSHEACSSWARTLQYRIDSLSSVMG